MAVIWNNAVGRRLLLGVLGLAAVDLWAAPGSSQARGPEGEQRYPYDPVCSWGRLADGRGMLVRCLKEDDVTALTTPAAEKREPAPVEAKPGTATPTEPEKEPAAKPEREITIDKVGPIVVDSGELPLAVKKLSEPKDRYLECVRKNGGLQAESAEVQVRFLVRERGRAEGVTVGKAKGMTGEAAKCIADVVDRRYVGYPAAPIVGATLPIVVTYRSK